MKNNYVSMFVAAVITLLVMSGLVYAAGPPAVNLGTAGNFAILAKSGVSTTATSLILGNVGVSPITSTAITGFALTLDSSGQFATSSQVNEKVYASDYSSPTPSMLTTAVRDMQTAYSNAADTISTNDTVGLDSGILGGETLAPGLYTWSTGVTITNDITLSGGPNDVWIFQIAQGLDVASNTTIILSGGAQPKNIFWQVAGQATLETTSNMKGVILSKTAIVMQNSAILDGCAYAQTAVTLIHDTVNCTIGSTNTAIPISCSGIPSLTFSPNPTAFGSSDISAIVSGLSNCNGFTITIKDYQGCNASAATIATVISNNSGGGVIFMSPNAEGQYGYYACVNNQSSTETTLTVSENGMPPAECYPPAYSSGKYNSNT
jgi:hypothetical protein